IVDSEIKSSNTSVALANNSNIYVSQSTITNNGSSASQFLVQKIAGGGSVLRIPDTDFIDNNGAGLDFDSNNGALSVNFENCNFYRTALATINNTPYINVREGTAPALVSIYSTLDGNRFCYEDPAVIIANPAVESFSGTPATPLILSNQVNNGVPLECTP
ncbi:MAG: hypothetical protein HRT44_09340, partial [Bdellovibrionales bacterium]|nr:hypothetical protein [Bdellovibrionales bacterium]